MPEKLRPETLPPAGQMKEMMGKWWYSGWWFQTFFMFHPYLGYLGK